MRPVPVRLLLPLVLAFCALPTIASRPRGLYALDGHLPNGTAPPLPPFVQGVSLRVNWNSIHKAPGVFNWTLVDAGLARARAAGVAVQLGIAPGTNTPPWVYEQGAAYFLLRWVYPFGRPLCSQAKLPLPWDAVFLQAWTGFVDELGRRYANDSAIAAIKVTGINAETMEQVLPSKNITQCGGLEDPNVQWQRLGYRPAKIVAAWASIISLFRRAFPGKALVLMTGEWGMPGVDAEGRLTGQRDVALQDNLTRQFVGALGASQAVLQNNGLNVGRAWTPPAGLPAGPVAVGAQALWSVHSDPTCRMAWSHPPCNETRVMQRTLGVALAANVSFFEVYMVDIVNPPFAPMLAAFANHYKALD